MKRNVCGKCGSTDLYASAPAYSGYVLKDGKWVHDGFEEHADRAMVYCNECDDEWEEYIEDDNDTDDEIPDKCYNPLPGGTVK